MTRSGHSDCCVNRKLTLYSGGTGFGLNSSRVMPMEADDPIAVVIAALNSFEPARDDTDNLYRLYQLFEGFSSLPDRHRAAPAMFGLLERFPDAEFGSPGPLVQELEAIPGYLPLLRDSVRRQPTYHTVWMVEINPAARPFARRSRIWRNLLAGEMARGP